VAIDAGAIGFVGSTTTAYGPVTGNSGADLLTQYFLIDVLAGASLGRALLRARHKFVLGEKTEDPVNLKTLAQFLLLGDPSLQPCLVETHAARLASPFVDQSAAREVRRVVLAAAGKGVADSSAFPGRRAVRPAKHLHNVVGKIAKQRAFRTGPEHVETRHIVGRGSYGTALKARGVEQKVVVVTEHSEARDKGAAMPHDRLPQTRVLVAHAHDNRVIDVAEYVRK